MQNPQQLKKKTFSGLTILISREFLLKVIAIIGQIILVRLLAPSYFGAFAILAFILGLADLFTDLGLTSAIIQKKEIPTRNELSSIYYVKQVMACFIYILLFVISGAIVSFYHNIPYLSVTMIRIFGLILLIRPLKNIVIGLLERELQYSYISLVDLISSTCYYIFAIIFIHFGFTIWAFIFASILSEISGCISFFIIKPWLPSWNLDLKKIFPMIHFGLYLQLGSILGFFHNSIIPVIGGLKTSATDVGLLDWASGVSTIPGVITSNVGRVAFAGYSRIQHDKELLSKALEKTIRYSVLILFLFPILTISVGPDVIHYILTDKWLPAAPSLDLFVITVAIFGMLTPIQQAVTALGETKKILITAFVVISSEWILAYILTIKIGFIGIAFASIVGALLLLFGYIRLAKNAGLTLHMVEILIPRIFVFIIVLLVALLLNNIVQQSFIGIFYKIFILTFLYVLLHWIFSKQDVLYGLQLIKSYFS